MRLTVNGEEKRLPHVKNVAELVAHYKLEDKLVVVEIDGDVVVRSEWQSMELQEGMSIELVHFVGGG